MRINVCIYIYLCVNSRARINSPPLASAASLSVRESSIDVVSRTDGLFGFCISASKGMRGSLGRD